MVLATVSILMPGAFAQDKSWAGCLHEGEAALAEQNLPGAEDSFRKALAQVSKASKNPADLENCMLKLADVLSLRGKTDEAQSLYAKLLTLLERHYGKNSQKIAPILIDLGSIQEAKGDHTTAMSYYQKALKINERNYGPYSPAVVGNLHKMGQSSTNSGDKAAARKHYKKAMDMLMQDPGLSSSDEMKSLLKDYNDLIQKQDNSNNDLLKDFKKEISPGANSGSSAPIAPDSQSAFQKQASFQLNVSKQTQTDEDSRIILRGMDAPASSATLAPAYGTMNETIFNQNHYEKGKDYYQRMIAIDEKSLGSSHPALANDLCGLSLLYIAEKRYAEAEPLLTRALTIYQAVYGEDNVLTINTGTTLALTQFHRGNIDGATQLYKTALSHGQAALGPNSLETARILNQLAYLYFHQGKLQEACTFYEWAVASTQSAVGKDDPLFAACLRDYAQVLRSMGRLAEASETEAKADKITLNK